MVGNQPGRGERAASGTPPHAGKAGLCGDGNPHARLSKKVESVVSQTSTVFRFPRLHVQALMRGIQACADAVALLEVLHGLALTHYGQAPSPLIPAARPGSSPVPFQTTPRLRFFRFPSACTVPRFASNRSAGMIRNASDVLGTLSAFVHSLGLYHPQGKLPAPSGPSLGDT